MLWVFELSPGTSIAHKDGFEACDVDGEGMGVLGGGNDDDDDGVAEGEAEGDNGRKEKDGKVVSNTDIAFQGKTDFWHCGFERPGSNSFTLRVRRKLFRWCTKYNYRIVPCQDED